MLFTWGYKVTTKAVLNPCTSPATCRAGNPISQVLPLFLLPPPSLLHQFTVRCPAVAILHPGCALGFVPHWICEIWNATANWHKLLGTEAQVSRWDPTSQGWKVTAYLLFFTREVVPPFPFHSSYNKRSSSPGLNSLSQYAVTTNWCWRVTNIIYLKPPSSTGWWKGHRVPVLPETWGEPSHSRSMAKGPV